MTTVDIQRLAQSILADLDARRPLHDAGTVAGLSIAQAYAVQRAVSDVRERRGERVIGYKIGCTSRAIQEQLGIRQPIFGRLFDPGDLRPGARVSCARHANLAVEGELAVRLARDVSNRPGSDEACAAAIASIFAVVELHDYVLRCNPPCAAELIVRNGMHAGFVAGDEVPAGPGPLPVVRRIGVRIDDAEAASTTEPWAMGSPGGAIRWLARALGEVGLRLRGGQVILTGSTMRLFPVGPGRVVTIEAPPLGRCDVAIGE